MRVYIAISVVVASMSSASAQFAMDHGRSADAAQAASAPKPAADAKPAAASGALTLPSQQTSFYVAGPGIVKIVTRSAADLKADEAGQAAWAARCRPIVVEDRDGLRRVRYAERDCDLSRFNTAGN
ncbi:hypothetical protein [Bradyrhizobium roseum]|uniref:hypothetical protein n=1 Tax=Bradyrhizobium roseum TaxID=3056648 RepID=UPI0026169BAC|nr:hypothetical protein [Bradyrhizobium roseus]WKA27097.1 hypothetical protein QUH67_26485 [Bradyrhizobium roseus]